MYTYTFSLSVNIWTYIVPTLNSLSEFCVLRTFTKQRPSLVSRQNRDYRALTLVKLHYKTVQWHLNAVVSALACIRNKFEGTLFDTFSRVLSDLS